MCGGRNAFSLEDQLLGVAAPLLVKILHHGDLGVLFEFTCQMILAYADVLGQIIQRNLVPQISFDVEHALLDALSCGGLGLDGLCLVKQKTVAKQAKKSGGSCRSK